MKKILNLKNLLFFAGIVYLGITSLPRIISNFSNEGQSVEGQEYQIIETGISVKKLIFPSQQRSITIFWATWCAPCKLEMARLSKSVQNGAIPSGSIIAINPFESTDTVRSFLKKESFPFTFIEDRGISQALNVNTTPTTLFIEDKKILSLSSGLSLIGIWKAERFL